MENEFNRGKSGSWKGRQEGINIVQVESTDGVS